MKCEYILFTIEFTTQPNFNLALHLSFFSVLNEMVLNVSLPDIANDFNKPPASTNWVNTAFMLTFSIGTAVYGKLSDQLGIKRLLLFGIIINCFGSVIGFVGHSFFSLLIMARFIQGLVQLHFQHS